MPDLGKLSRQLLHVERLEDDSCRSKRSQLAALGPSHDCGQKDNRNSHQVWISLKVFKECRPIETRHQKIEENQIGRDFARSPQGMLWVGAKMYAHASETFEGQFDDGVEVFLIINA